MAGDGRTERDARSSSTARDPRTQGVGDAIATVVGPLVEAHGLDLERVEESGSGDSTVVRVVVDADAGTDLDDLAELSRELSTALDGADPDPLGDRRYTLEVTSPGVDRPLTAPRHWRRAQGRKVTATLRTASGPDERVAGRVGRLDEAAGTVDVVVPGRRGTWDVRSLPLADITAAVVGVDFSSPGPAELELCGIDGADARREGNR
ncbi:ribosome maturation factor RimP [Williamsia serinedens]|uniref:Ribosome maturation factor RimP n=2 Tax=Williamsia serinedens TaxID=391736 RepID=A0ABT1GVJ4_9NOCA|nr:ribosome maturation factor RimP [Williamsia serinedens]MCP2158999.1 ribosome maturation factor RimP [Williamsia serinedens]